MTWAADPARKPRLDTRSRMVIAVWAMLFLNVLSFAKDPLIIPIPHKVGQLITQGALVLALVWAVRLNRSGRIRPNVFLTLFGVLALTSAMMSVRVSGIGTDYRAYRLLAFLAVLWLLTPWWSSPKLVLLRGHMYVLVAILVMLLLGLAVSPHKALAINYGAHRLSGAFWPMPATQVGHYMAELCGLTAILWMCGLLRRRTALCLLVPGLTALLLSQTRTALLGLAAGLLVGGISLFRTRRRVRKVFAMVAILVVAVVVPLMPVVRHYVDRGQTSAEVSNLSGRTQVWPLVLSEPRPEINKILGSGMSNGSVINQPDPRFNGLPIDGSWIATYQDQGLVGDILEGLIFLFLLVAAVWRPQGPTRALALFLITYCLFASFTETGMGQASPYLLDLAVAASMLVPRRSSLAEGDAVDLAVTPGALAG